MLANANSALLRIAVVLGEETVPGGKTWYACKEPNTDPRFECEEVETNKMGNPFSSDDTFLCKETPLTERKPLLRNPFKK